ncbi:MAG TPA: hypothetical protein VEJ20_08475, partial [Candidatus Eremiobacteraceae bacterium]|nr:hypothetical protein [Candidatus Eremiobacteraceae bacterium]
TPIVSEPVHHVDPCAQHLIVVSWEFKNHDGNANLIVNPDGTYLYSGSFKPANYYNDVEVVIALRSSLGAVLLFRYIGNDQNGNVQWSKEGQSDILKDNFQTFAGPHDWTGKWTLPPNSVGQKIARNDAYNNCSGDAWIGLLGLEPGLAKYCSQFNSSW